MREIEQAKGQLDKAKKCMENVEAKIKDLATDFELQIGMIRIVVYEAMKKRGDLDEIDIERIDSALKEMEDTIISMRELKNEWDEK